jgi:hypothetical protein
MTPVFEVRSDFRSNTSLFFESRHDQVTAREELRQQSACASIRTTGSLIAMTSPENFPATQADIQRLEAHLSLLIERTETLLDQTHEADSQLDASISRLADGVDRRFNRVDEWLDRTIAGLEHVEQTFHRRTSQTEQRLTRLEHWMNLAD